MASRCRYAAKKQAKLLSHKKDELSEALINPVTEYQNGLLTLTRRNDEEGGDNTVPQFISESGQSGTSSGTRKHRTAEEKREAERRRYAANREAIKAARKRRYAAEKQAKLQSQKKKKKLSEALINPVTEYQNGLLMLPRKNDGERGDKSVSLFISESGQAGASSGTRKCRTVQERRAAGKRRYASNQEAIKAVLRGFVEPRDKIPWWSADIAEKK